jgi:hypothetical protein
MAVYGFSWVIPTALGPLLAGLIMDNIDPRGVWFSAGMLARVTQGKWTSLSQQASMEGRRDLHIRVSDLDSGAVNLNLTLLLGLVSAALNTGGRLATGLDGLDLAFHSDWRLSGAGNMARRNPCKAVNK